MDTNGFMQPISFRKTGVQTHHLFRLNPVEFTPPLRLKSHWTTLPIAIHKPCVYYHGVLRYTIVSNIEKAKESREGYYVEVTFYFAVLRLRTIGFTR